MALAARKMIPIEPRIHHAVRVYAAQHDISLKQAVETAIIALIGGNKTPKQTAQDILKRGKQ